MSTEVIEKRYEPFITQLEALLKSDVFPDELAGTLKSRVSGKIEKDEDFLDAITQMYYDIQAWYVGEKEYELKREYLLQELKKDKKPPQWLKDRIEKKIKATQLTTTDELTDTETLKENFDTALKSTQKSLDNYAKFISGLVWFLFAVFCVVTFGFGLFARKYVDLYISLFKKPDDYQDLVADSDILKDKLRKDKIEQQNPKMAAIKKLEKEFRRMQAKEILEKNRKDSDGLYSEEILSDKKISSAILKHLPAQSIPSFAQAGRLFRDSVLQHPVMRYCQAPALKHQFDKTSDILQFDDGGKVTQTTKREVVEEFDRKVNKAYMSIQIKDKDDNELFVINQFGSRVKKVGKVSEQLFWMLDKNDCFKIVDRNDSKNIIKYGFSGKDYSDIRVIAQDDDCLFVEVKNKQKNYEYYRLNVTKEEQKQIDDLNEYYEHPVVVGGKSSYLYPIQLSSKPGKHQLALKALSKIDQQNGDKLPVRFLHAGQLKIYGEETSWGFHQSLSDDKIIMPISNGAIVLLDAKKLQQYIDIDAQKCLTPTPIQTYQLPKNLEREDILDIAVSPDEKVLSALVDGYEVVFWEISTGKLLTHFQPREQRNSNIHVVYSFKSIGFKDNGDVVLSSHSSIVGGGAVLSYSRFENLSENTPKDEKRSDVSPTK